MLSNVINAYLKIEKCLTRHTIYLLKIDRKNRYFVEKKNQLKAPIYMLNSIEYEVNFIFDSFFN